MRVAPTLIALVFLVVCVPAHGQTTLDDLRDAPKYSWVCSPATGPVLGYIWAVADWPCTDWRLYASSPDCEIVLPFGAEKCVRVRARQGWAEEFGPWSQGSLEPGRPCVCEEEVP